MITLPTIAALGAGSMAGAVVRGLLASPEVQLTGVRTTNRSPETAAAWAELPGVEASATAGDATANRRAVEGAAVLLVGVKPYQVLDLLREVAPAVGPDTLVISLAAGITCDAMARELPTGVAIVRTAASITSLVGLGVTGLASRPGTVAAEQQQLVESIFGTVGITVPVAEDDLHALAAISGSGPAYLYYLLERFTETALHHGIDPLEADRLVRATFIGAAELLRHTGHTPAELRRQVSSPMGSTERAIAVLADADLTSVFDHAVDAAIARTREMGA